MIYLDTSALIKLYILEPDSGDIQGLVSAQDDPLPVWELQEMELTNALRLKVFWGDITPVDSERQLELFRQRKEKGHYYFPELDRAAFLSTFQRLSAQTPALGCRTLDIMHVACACLLSPDLFVSFDTRQRQLAANAGLTVYGEEVDG